MKICVIGYGSAAATSLIAIDQFIKERNLKTVEVTCIHDPKTPTIKVGESTSAKFAETVAGLFGITNLYNNKKEFIKIINNFDGTLKQGTKFYWKKAHGNNFTINLSEQSFGLHLNSITFGSFIIKYIKKKNSYFNIIKTKVKDLTQDGNGVKVYCGKNVYEYDFVIDCRGSPEKTDLKDYSLPDTDFVNSVILYSKPVKNKTDNYTSATVHRNGWMFSIPLRNKTTWGYLYNNKITSSKEAIKEFSRIKKIKASKLRSFFWNQQFKKQAMEGRVLSLGNRLNLLEPTGALALHYYLKLLLTVLPDIMHEDGNYINFTYTSAIANRFHLESIQKMQDIIAINYCGMNNIKSAFWDYAKRKSNERLKNSADFKRWLHNYRNNRLTSYWDFSYNYFLSYINGYRINLGTKNVDVI